MIRKEKVGSKKLLHEFPSKNGIGVNSSLIRCNYERGSAEVKNTYLSHIAALRLTLNCCHELF